MKLARSTPQKLIAPSRLRMGLFVLFVLIYVNLPPAWQIPCLFHTWSGFPCPTCGTTRCAELIFQGHLGAAFILQPLMFCVLILCGLLIFYPVACRLLRQPVLYIQLETRRERIVFGSILILLIVTNWIYLI